MAIEAEKVARRLFANGRDCSRRDAVVRDLSHDRSRRDATVSDWARLFATRRNCNVRDWTWLSKTGTRHEIFA
ncbi:hypothetical protein CRG98_001170 [Punica granatum]|uniref:Uncharacterized protein n=1 Tax=Punica granatum TaxID=22663 RepID=A0A2I0LCQ1_PUNGR|nr:hypothetical protein CRG98_001170 [Punica granatum]